MTAPHDDASPRLGRRLLLAVGVAVLLAGVFAWTRYDPIATAGPIRCPPAAAEEVQEDGSTICALDNTAAVDATFGLTVRNEGLVPVQIRGVALPAEVAGVLRVVDTRAGASDETLDRFEAFRLGRGEQWRIEVTGRLPECERVTRQRVATFSELPLRSSVLGLPRTTRVTLEPPLQLLAVSC